MPRLRPQSGGIWGPFWRNRKTGRGETAEYRPSSESYWEQAGQGGLRNRTAPLGEAWQRGSFGWLGGDGSASSNKPVPFQIRRQGAAAVPKCGIWNPSLHRNVSLSPGVRVAAPAKQSRLAPKLDADAGDRGCQRWLSGKVSRGAAPRKPLSWHGWSWSWLKTSKKKTP